MDQAIFDRLSRRLADGQNRRRLVGLAGLGLGSLWSEPAEVDGKKKKKKRKGKKKKASKGPGPGNGQCVELIAVCTDDSQCCETEYSSAHPVCQQVYGVVGKDCCIPNHAQITGFNLACCGTDSEESPEGGYRCCIRTGHANFGHPEHCCTDSPNINGFCCIKSGYGCRNDEASCCSGVCGSDGYCP